MKFNIMRVFKDVNMSYQHRGLKDLARLKKINLDLLSRDELVIFLNSPLTAVKVYSPDGGIHYYRPGNKLNMEMIAKIPKCFNPNGSINFDKASRMGLEELLKRQEAKRPIGLLLEEK